MKFLLILLVLLGCFAYIAEPFAAYKANSVRNKHHQLSSTQNDLFWTDGLKFGCTGCGRCCQNEGEVYLDTDEFSEIASHLKLSQEDFLSIYTEKVSSGWTLLKSKENKELDNMDQCIFLAEDGKRCTIYEVRPVQCRTYPYWTHLISSKERWVGEAVVSVDVPGKHWSPEEGGCEGINHVDAPTINPNTIFRNYELYEQYNDKFPFMATGDDEKRLLAKAGAIERISTATKSWVKDFVIKYNLCPFAENVFSGNKVRYRVFLESDRDRVVERVKFELYNILISNPEHAETTLLMLPFAFPNFEEFHEFSLELEDVILPQMEKDSRVETSKKESKPRKSLLQKIKKKSHNEDDEEQQEIQLAFFHPAFEWGDSEEFNSPLNFEKRAPFPTINLLRAATIREYANQKRTASIADGNKLSLESQGSEVLSKEFNDIIASALTGL